MEDILASIRRILSEDEAPPATGAPPAAEQPAPVAGDGVLVLDPAMLVGDPAREAEPVEPPLPVAMPAPPPVAIPEPPLTEPPPREESMALVAPEAAAAGADAPTKHVAANGSAETATPAHAKRRSARAEEKTPRAPRQPRLRVVEAGVRARAAAESAASPKVKAAKPRKSRPIAAAR